MGVYALFDPLAQFRLRLTGIVCPAQDIHLRVIGRIAKTEKYGHGRNQRILLGELSAVFLDKTGKKVRIGITPEEAVQRSVVIEIVPAKTVIGHGCPDIVDMHVFPDITLERLVDLRLAPPIDTGAQTDGSPSLVQRGEQGFVAWDIRLGILL